MNKQNIILGLNIVIVAMLGILLYKSFSGPSHSNMQLNAQNLSANKPGATNPAQTVQPIDPNAQPAQTDVVDPATATKVEFKAAEFNFGTVKAGAKVSHVFKFRNTGDKPLVIKDAHASCGCTVADWPHDPIPPGGVGEIKSVFDSAGKQGLQTKTITVTANTIPAKTELLIKGEVIGDPNAPVKAAH